MNEDIGVWGKKNKVLDENGGSLDKDNEILDENNGMWEGGQKRCRSTPSPRKRRSQTYGHMQDGGRQKSCCDLPSPFCWVN